MRKGKYSMHARLFENYENGMILAQASKQASKQAERCYNYVASGFCHAPNNIGIYKRFYQGSFLRG